MPGAEPPPEGGGGVVKRRGPVSAVARQVGSPSTPGLGVWSAPVGRHARLLEWGRVQAREPPTRPRGDPGACSSGRGTQPTPGRSRFRYPGPILLTSRPGGPGSLSLSPQVALSLPPVSLGFVSPTPYLSPSLQVSPFQSISLRASLSFVSGSLSVSLSPSLCVSVSLGSLSLGLPVSRCLSRLSIPVPLCLSRLAPAFPSGPVTPPSPSSSLTASRLLSVLLPSPTSSSSSACCSAPRPLGSSFTGWGSSGAAGASGSWGSSGCT